jgi:hypothetical protein
MLSESISGTKGYQSLRQSDYASFLLGIKCPNLLPLPLTERWPITALETTHLPEVNKPQARISGVGMSMCYSIDSNTCIKDSYQDNLILGSYWTGLYGRQRDTVDGISLAVPSAEHPPAWDLTTGLYEGRGTHGGWNQPGCSFS